MPKIGITGDTAESKALAVYLLSAGYDVELVCKTSGLTIDDDMVIDVVGLFGTKSRLVPTVEREEYFTSKKDIIFIMGKAYDSVEQSREAMKHLSANGVIVTRNNVLNFRDISAVVDIDRWIGMYLEWSAMELNGAVNINNDGNTIIGAFTKGGAKYLKVVRQAIETITPTFATKNMSSFILSRVVLNIPIAMLGGVTGLKLGQILSKRQGKKLFVRIVKECIKLFDTMGVRIMDYDHKLDYHKFISNSFVGIRYRHTMLKRLATQNNQVRSSISVDIERGMRSEMEYYIGTLIKYADDYKVKIPVCRRLYKMLQDIEAGVRTTYMDNLYDEKLVMAINGGIR